LNLADPEGDGPRRVHETQAGAVLVLGGDQAYPFATMEEYRNRLVGPFRSVLPWTWRPRWLFAIPGNHDWYDSLNAYQHAFMGQGRRLGARRFVQEQSYFAAELPHGWWLLGVDIALAQRVDDRQVAFVRGAIAQMDGDARVILVIAKPAWLDDPLSRGSRNLAFVESLLPAGSLRLVLTGDVHHYARYATAADGPTRITCGGGGAYTAGTHRLPAQLAAAWRPDHRSDAPSLQAVSPSRETSKWMRRHVVGAFVGQPTFVATVGILVLVLDLLLLSGDAAASASTIDRLRAASFGEAWGAAVRGLAHAPLAAVGFGAVAVALITLAVALRQPVRVLPATLLGVAHAGAQLTVILATLWWLLHLDVHGTPGALVVAAGVPIIGGVTASLLCGLYLLAADRMVRHSAISFAVQGRTEWKSFARLHVDADGNLELFAVGLPQVVKTWARNPAAGPDRPDPRLVPTAPRRDLGVDARDDALGEPPFVTLIERVVL